MRSRLLDLFCGAGGAAMGYHQAGFEVIGVDIKPQPHYPFEFHQGDAMTWPLDNFDAVHASPPCQAHSRMARATGKTYDTGWMLQATIDRLTASGIPWVCENVDTSGIPGTLLCGAAMGLQIIRHRLFASSFLLLSNGCAHRPGGTTDGTYVAFRHHDDARQRITPRSGNRAYRAAMNVEWMPLKASRQAIPPTYTEFIGEQLLGILKPIPRA